jgi:hypothetical protein
LQLVSGHIRKLTVVDDFEVSVFFTDTSTRHSVLSKSIVFSTQKKPKPLTDWLEPGQDGDSVNMNADEPIIIREESPDEPGLGDDVSESGLAEAQAQGDEKKAPRTSYEGFSIYGRVLCLVIKRTNLASADSKTTSSQHLMENWVSTQAAKANYEEPGPG